jgi:hypothetical protein
MLFLLHRQPHLPWRVRKTSWEEEFQELMVLEQRHHHVPILLLQHHKNLAALGQLPCHHHRFNYRLRRDWLQHHIHLPPQLNHPLFLLRSRFCHELTAAGIRCHMVVHPTIHHQQPSATHMYHHSLMNTQFAGHPHPKAFAPQPTLATAAHAPIQTTVAAAHPPEHPSPLVHQPKNAVSPAPVLACGVLPTRRTVGYLHLLQ